MQGIEGAVIDERDVCALEHVKEANHHLSQGQTHFHDVREHFTTFQVLDMVACGL